MARPTKYSEEMEKKGGVKCVERRLTSKERRF